MRRLIESPEGRRWLPRPAAPVAVSIRTCSYASRSRLLSAVQRLSADAFLDVLDHIGELLLRVDEIDRDDFYVLQFHRLSSS
jgi:hypothetical protein